MVQQLIQQNKEMLKSLTLNIEQAKRDLSIFMSLWKYVQEKEKRNKVDVKTY